MRILAFVQPGYLLQNGHEPLHGLGVIVGEEQALAAVQCFDGSHIFSRQGEVKEVEVLLHPILVGRLGDDDHVTLHQETKGSLCGGLAVLLADLRQDGVGEHILATLGEGTP